MFRGLNAVAMDAKGRVAIPVKYRELIHSESGGALVATVDTEERCLLLYLLPQWEKIERKLENLPSYHPASRRIQRLLIGHATELEMDRSGRVLIPPLLREYAGLGQMIMLVGQGKKFEVWGESQWEMARESWLGDEIHADTDLPPEVRDLSL